ncbi:hypothetical protein O6H91_13G067400 [Diphasiastrum complanatum]|uniref:Uncharacterized protein n=1 Tax=Diphasiastrum complanatum TaxID=34168 RepID=A0ACC2BVN3_DIPCM|nr:hypothetical protein O6H91_13G067400 [Diphasiastrum complanatum]
MSSYEKVKGGKLSFKGGIGVDKIIQKKKKKKRKGKSKLEEEEEDPDKEEDGVDMNGKDPSSEKKEAAVVGGFEIDTGTGFAPDGKKSKHYEELFPVETKRFGYAVPEVQSREAALDERVKRKADRYCK